MAGTPISLPFSGRLLRVHRERRGLNQQALANRFNEHGRAFDREISRGQISKLELGVHKPTPETLEVLCLALDLGVDDLLEAGAA